MKFPFYKQLESMDCGPACLRMITKYYGKSIDLTYLRNKCLIQRNGVSILGISEAAESIGFRSIAVKLDYKTLQEEATLPCIVHYNQNHFVVVFKIDKRRVWLADPARGIGKMNRKEFEKMWISTSNINEQFGIALLMEPSPSFVISEDAAPSIKLNAVQLIKHIHKYKSLFCQLFLGILVGVLLQTILPFLTQSVVDIGISSKDIDFITLVMIGQLMIFFGSVIIDFIRSWILLHINTRLNISLLTDFFIKLVRLPMSYFDNKLTGDIMQRMADHTRIQSFLTIALLNTFLSIISFVVFTMLTVFYSLPIFLVFLLGSIIYLCWIAFFLRARRIIDFKKFDISSSNQNITVEMIQGMQEIKLNNCERQKRWRWEKMQAKLFKINIHALQVNQLQSSGALFINQGKNVLLTFLSAKEVINGSLSLGGMMAVQYIIGQLNSPMQQIIQFIQSLQDARISLDRINEIRDIKDEEPNDKNLLVALPVNKSIRVSKLSYRYPGYNNEYVLRDLHFFVPEGKTTAIVGLSGSGKSTLLKLLLKFYNFEEGEIRVGNHRLSNISHAYWRSKCGVVLQDGFIFSDSIAGNIAVGDDTPDPQKLQHAITIANIDSFIESLPLGLNTRIGAQGSGLSQGQKQRILIARAVYKNPEYIFFDEATNSLDADNEKIIMNNLESFFFGKTVIVVAHRLSTVKNADQIIVLDNGRIIESGTHVELTALQKHYYRLVKNQLELST